jgi:hypothetical protein
MSINGGDLWERIAATDDVDSATQYADILSYRYLMVLLKHSSVKVIKMLLERKRIKLDQVLSKLVDMSNSTTGDECNALNKLFKSLTECKRISEDLMSTIVCAAIHGNNVGLMKVLSEDPQFDLNCQNGFAIGVATQQGDDEMVQLLLSCHRCDPSWDNNYAYNEAVSRGHVSTAELLLNDPRVAKLANHRDDASLDETIKLRSENERLREQVNVLLRILQQAHELLN